MTPQQRYDALAQYIGELEAQLSGLMANGSSPDARLPEWRDRVARIQDDLRFARQEFAELGDVLGKRVCRRCRCGGALFALPGV